MGALLLALLIAGCSRNPAPPGVTFHRSELSNAELETLKQATGGNWNSSDVFRAQWRQGPSRDIVVQDVGLSGSLAHARVAVFFPNVRLGEITRVAMPEGYEPFRLLQACLPVVIWFRDPGGRRRDFFAEAMSATEMEKVLTEGRNAMALAIASSTDTQVVDRLRQLQESVQSEIDNAAERRTAE
jgi:hypothetical protein